MERSWPFSPKQGKASGEYDSDLPITGGPGADENLVLVGSSEGDVLAWLISESGDEAWRSKVSSEILSPPRESDGVVVVRTIDGKVFALDATTGDRLWIYDRTVPTLTLTGYQHTGHCQWSGYRSDLMAAALRRLN